MRAAHDEGPSTDSEDRAAPGDAAAAAARIKRWPSAGAMGTCQVCGTSLAALREYYQRLAGSWRVRRNACMSRRCMTAVIRHGAAHHELHAHVS